jgi:N-acyl-D-amino-acid deacylase
MRPIYFLVMGAALAVAQPAAAAAPEALRQSIARSENLLDKAQEKFEHQATCASCHTQLAPIAAAAAMQAHGLAVNDAVLKRQVAMAAEVIRGRHDYSLNQGVAAGGHAVTGPLLVGLADAHYPADENTDAAVAYLLAKQTPGGSWPNVAVRAPHGETAYEVSSSAVRAIDAYAPPALRKQADAALASARAWMIVTPAGTNGDAMNQRLQGLVSVKASAAEIARARGQIAATQKPDGGWAQKPGMASDAYATAGALVALHQGGMKPTDPVYQKGLDYLLSSQAADGSWYVKAHALPIQPPIDSGFPYGPDQWISTWATAYAVEAMAYAL